MTNGKIDRRAERTRAALMSAFVERVLTDGYEATAVGDIVRRANVGRSTFYTHYSSKEALLMESLERPCRGLVACAGGDAMPQMLIPLLEHFREQRRLNRVFFEDPIRRLWVKRLAVLIERQVSLESRAGRGRARIPRSLLALTIAEMQIALVVHWLTSAVAVKSEVIAEALVFNTRAMLAAAR
jgi:AcrR family transcriptional regulator